jgi:hypothetical protein
MSKVALLFLLFFTSFILSTASTCEFGCEGSIDGAGDLRCKGTIRTFSDKVVPAEYTGFCTSNGTKIRYLFFQNNPSVTSLPLGLFKELQGLEGLYLENNMLTTIHPGELDYLQSLRHIDFYSNDLRSLPVGLFDKLKNLESINLSGNQLTTLPPRIFDKLPNLQELQLEDNLFTSLPSGDFDFGSIVDFFPLLCTSIFLSLFQLVCLIAVTKRSRLPRWTARFIIIMSFLEVALSWLFLVYFFVGLVLLICCGLIFPYVYVLLRQTPRSADTKSPKSALLITWLIVTLDVCMFNLHCLWVSGFASVLHDQVDYYYTLARHVTGLGTHVTSDITTGYVHGNMFVAGVSIFAVVSLFLVVGTEKVRMSSSRTKAEYGAGMDKTTDNPTGVTVTVETAPESIQMSVSEKESIDLRTQERQRAMHNWIARQGKHRGGLPTIMEHDRTPPPSYIPAPRH